MLEEAIVLCGQHRFDQRLRQLLIGQGRPPLGTIFTHEDTIGGVNAQRHLQFQILKTGHGWQTRLVVGTQGVETAYRRQSTYQP